MIYKILNFDTKKFVNLFREKGYIHVKDGLNKKFIELAKDLYFKNPKFKRKTRNSYRLRFELPNSIAKEFADTIGLLEGVNPKKVVISEQHFLEHEGDKHVLHWDQPWEEYALLATIDRPDNKLPTYLDIYENFLAPDPSLSRFKREIYFYKNFRNKTATKPTRIISDVGDVVIFKASQLAHQRINPNSILHFRLAANTLDWKHPYNNSYEMMADTYPVPPEKMPTWATKYFPKCEHFKKIIYKKNIFKRFWKTGLPEKIKNRNKIKARFLKVFRLIFASKHPEYKFKN